LNLTKTYTERKNFTDMQSMEDDQNGNALHIDNNDNLWMNHAECKGRTADMFPGHHKDITYITQARFICSECPVKAQCLEYALEFPPADMHGVWAGLTSRQLAAEQRRRGVKPIRPTLSQLWGS
jgi:WhiB family redox-sensing transcriptional regulator